MAAIVRDEHGALLLHRRQAEGAWAPPSGRVEPGERWLDALRRELREETGLQITVERLVGVYSDPEFQVVRYPEGDLVHFYTSLFAVRGRGDLRGSSEGSEWGWFRPEELPSPLLPYAEVWITDALADSPEAIAR